MLEAERATQLCPSLGSGLLLINNPNIHHLNDILTFCCANTA